MAISNNGKHFFKKVTTTVKVGQSRRHQGGGTLEASGVLKLNTNGSRSFMSVLRSSGLDPTKCITSFGVDGELVAAFISPPGTPGGAPFRVLDVPKTQQKAVTLYLHGVFEENPDLRPDGKKQVSVAVDVDAEGNTYLLINLQGALGTRTVHRKKEGEGQEEEKPKDRKSPPPEESVAPAEDADVTDAGEE